MRIKLNAWARVPLVITNYAMLIFVIVNQIADGCGSRELQFQCLYANHNESCDSVFINIINYVTDMLCPRVAEKLQRKLSTTQPSLSDQVHVHLFASLLYSKLQSDQMSMGRIMVI